MTVVVHYPQNPEDVRILKGRVAKAHAQGIMLYIDKLFCSKEQKLELLNTIHDYTAYSISDKDAEDKNSQTPV